MLSLCFILVKTFENDEENEDDGEEKYNLVVFCHCNRQDLSVGVLQESLHLCHFSFVKQTKFLFLSLRSVTFSDWTEFTVAWGLGSLSLPAKWLLFSITLQLEHSSRRGREASEEERERKENKLKNTQPNKSNSAWIQRWEGCSYMLIIVYPCCDTA